MENCIVIAVVAAVVSAAIGHIIKMKKKGAKCIGCPYCENCSKNSCGK